MPPTSRWILILALLSMVVGRVGAVEQPPSPAEWRQVAEKLVRDPESPNVRASLSSLSRMPEADRQSGTLAIILESISQLQQETRYVRRKLELANEQADALADYVKSLTEASREIQEGNREDSEGAGDSGSPGSRGPVQTVLETILRSNAEVARLSAASHPRQAKAADDLLGHMRHQRVVLRRLNELAATLTADVGVVSPASSASEPGCYLRIGGGVEDRDLRQAVQQLATLLEIGPVAPGRPFFVPVGITREWCGSLYLAKRYNADGIDFAHLLDTYGLQMSPAALEAVSQHLAVGGKRGVPVEVIYRTGAGEDNPIPPVRDQLRSGRCQVLDYFSIPLYCFNRATGKPDHLGYMIPYLTIMLYTSDGKFWNPLTQESTTAHQFLYNSQIKIFDGTVPALIRSNYGDMFQDAPSDFEICGGGDAAKSAHARRIGDQNLAFMCAQSLSEAALEKKVRKASVVYHEVNHPVGEHLSNNWTQARVEGHVNCSADRPPHEGDIGMVSVFGAQIFYQFYLSSHPRLSCEQRKTIFWSAKKNLRCNLCKKWKTNGKVKSIPASHEMENSPPQCQGQSLVPPDDPCL